MPDDDKGVCLTMEQMLNECKRENAKLREEVSIYKDKYQGAVNTIHAMSINAKHASEYYKEIQQ